MLIRQAGRAGADILLVPSSDWEAIAEMHRRMAVFRGVENGVNLVPPTRQGTSLASDYQGRLLGYKSDDFRAFQIANELYGAATSPESRKLVLLKGALHADQLLQPTAPTKPQVEDEILGEPADVADPRLATWMRRTGRCRGSP